MLGTGPGADAQRVALPHAHHAMAVVGSGGARSSRRGGARWRSRRRLSRRGRLVTLRRGCRGARHDGRVFLSSTMLDGRYTLRMAALAFRTHRRTIDLAVRVLREQAAALARPT